MFAQFATTLKATLKFAKRTTNFGARKIGARDKEKGTVPVCTTRDVRERKRTRKSVQKGQSPSQRLAREGIAPIKVSARVVRLGDGPRLPASESLAGFSFFSRA